MSEDKLTYSNRKVIAISRENYNRLAVFACQRFTNPNQILTELLDTVECMIDEVLEEIKEEKEFSE